MSEQTRSPHKSNKVQRALAHPVRAQLLTELQKGTASPSQLSEVVKESVGVTSYHVRVLAEAGLIELVGEVPKRGALQHFYAARAHDTVGTSLQMTSEDAESVRRDIRDRVAKAYKTAEQRPGKKRITVVVHTDD